MSITNAQIKIKSRKELPFGIYEANESNFCIKKDSEYTLDQVLFFLIIRSYVTYLQTYRPSLIMKFPDLMTLGHTISPVNGGRSGDRDSYQEPKSLFLGERAYFGRDISKIQRIYDRQCRKYQADKSTFF